MKRLKVILVIVFIQISAMIIYSQQVTGETREIKESIISSNEITTILYNYGSICKPNILKNVADLVWKKKRLGNMFEFGPLISAEVIGENGETLHITSDSFVLTAQGDYNADGTEKWGWLPRSGYSNPNSNEIANSLNSESWPSSWSYWPGEFGDDIIIAENELFYVMDDFSNAEFSYYPFPSDSTKRGLGVSAEVRVYQFLGFLKDALIVKYKVTNESPKDLKKVYFGFQGDPHIGGATDWSDDRVGFLPNNYKVKEAANTIYVYDDDGIGYAGRQTGFLGFKLLKTPHDLGLTSLHVAQYTNSYPNVPKNDPLMWEWFSADSIDLNQPLLNKAGDNIINLGTGPFELKSGESVEIELAIFLSDDFDDILKDAFAIQHYINWPILKSDYNYSTGNENYKIELNELQKENEGNVEVSWNYTGSDPNAKVFIDYSANGGKEWIPLTIEQSINENYIWDTKLVNDGVNYALRVLAYNPDNVREFYYDNCNERFTINNPEKNSVPEFKFVQLTDTLRREKATIKWILEDADNSEHTIIIEHSTNPEGAFKKIYEGTHNNGDNSFWWDLSNTPNYATNYLRFTIKDDENEVVSISDEFVINVKRAFYSSSQIEHIKGSTTAEIEIIVTDTSAINNDKYEITFSVEENGKRYSIRNLNSNDIVINNIKLIDGMSSPTFEGLRVNIKDPEMDINYNHTHFSRDELEPTYNVYFSESNGDYVGSPHSRSSLDWIVVFNDLDTNSDGSWVNVGESTLFIPSMKDGVSPFKILDVDNNEKANYLIDETKIPTLVNNKWDEEEAIILRPKIFSAAEVSYALNFDFSSGNFPQLGDTLYIVTNNPIDSNDVFQFKADDKYILSNKDNTIKSLEKFTLSQNYPNPFNPSTTINYSIPAEGLHAASSNVTLKIYDILGREVAILVNKEQSAGNYSVKFNASNLTSGIYFYKLQSGSFVETKKMLLMK